MDNSTTPERSCPSRDPPVPLLSRSSTLSEEDEELDIVPDNTAASLVPNMKSSMINQSTGAFALAHEETKDGSIFEDITACLNSSTINQSTNAFALSQEGTEGVVILDDTADSLIPSLNGSMMNHTNTLALLQEQTEADIVPNNIDAPLTPGINSLLTESNQTSQTTSSSHANNTYESFSSFSFSSIPSIRIDTQYLDDPTNNPSTSLLSFFERLPSLFLNPNYLMPPPVPLPSRKDCSCPRCLSAKRIAQRPVQERPIKRPVSRLAQRPIEGSVQGPIQHPAQRRILKSITTSSESTTIHYEYPSEGTPTTSTQQSSRLNIVETVATTSNASPTEFTDVEAEPEDEDESFGYTLSRVPTRGKQLSSQFTTSRTRPSSRLNIVQTVADAEPEPEDEDEDGTFGYALQRVPTLGKPSSRSSQLTNTHTKVSTSPSPAPKPSIYETQHRIQPITPYDGASFPASFSPERFNPSFNDIPSELDDELIPDTMALESDLGLMTPLPSVETSTSAERNHNDNEIQIESSSTLSAIGKVEEVGRLSSTVSLFALPEATETTSLIPDLSPGYTDGDGSSELAQYEDSNADDEVILQAGDFDSYDWYKDDEWVLYTIYEDPCEDV